MFLKIIYVILLFLYILVDLLVLILVVDCGALVESLVEEKRRPQEKQIGAKERDKRKNKYKEINVGFSLV